MAILSGTLFGFVARVIMLRTDYRQYPTYRHGKVIHLALGFIAAGLGAVAVPALKENNYTAVTFLALAAQQFRDVRNMERGTLSQLDGMELVPRGSAYIEGIAMVFEGRNYLVIFTSFLTSLGVVWFNIWVGLLFGAISLLVDLWFMSGHRLADIARIKEGEIRIEGESLYVNQIYIMNVGLISNREILEKHAVGLVIQPKNLDSAVTLANLGQRQAILHDASVILGVYRDSGEPALVPLIKRDMDTGELGVLLLPQRREMKKAIQVVERVPVLETALRLPKEAKVNGGNE
ncbi:MAG: YIEGIA domain-containing protein [Thermicanus sp.]|nr:YIEGIA domain-containing protein [Thermicanus sp.]